MYRSMILIAVLCAGAAGCEKAAAPATEVSGKALYDQYCAACHGPAGEVRQAEERDLMAPDLRTISERYSGRFPRTVLREVIDGRRVVEAHGSRAMPAWGAGFTASERSDAGQRAAIEAKINALMAYVESIQTQ